MARSVDILVNAQDRASRKFSRIERGSKRLGTGFTALKAAALGAGAAIGVMVVRQVGRAIRWVGNQVRETVAAFIEQEKVETKLTAVLEATGAAAGFTAEQLIKEAKALQEITTFGDEAIINTQAILATFKQIKGDAFKEATVAIADMSIVLGQDLQAGAIQVGKALNDPIRGVTALSRVGVTFTDQQREQIKVLQESGKIAEAQGVILRELRGEFGGAAEAAGKTFGGSLTQLGNIIGDVKEDIGRTLAPIISGFVAVIKENMPAIRGFFLGLIDQFKNFVRGAVVAFTFVETAVQAWRSIMEFAITSVALGIVTLGNTIQHWFTVVIPEVLLFLSRNWQQILLDIWEFQKTFTINVGKNIWNLVKAIKDALSGKGFTFEWTGLLEGFESSLKELPKIAERELSGTEKQLAKTLAEVGKDVGDAFGDQMDTQVRDRLARLGLLTGAEKKAITPGALAGAPEAAAEAQAASRQRRQLQAFESLFLTRAPGIEPAQQTAQNTKELVILQREELKIAQEARQEKQQEGPAIILKPAHVGQGA